MSYLIPADYKKQIQTDNLNQVIGSDTSIQAAAELAAQEEITSYLTQKYDLSQEFTPTNLWDAAKAYNAKDRVYDGTGAIYYGATTYNDFDYTANYNVGDIVFWKNNFYTCQIATRQLTDDQAIQYNEYAALPLGNVFPDDTVNGAAFWGNPTAYAIPAGTLLTNPKWIKGDNRSQQMVMVMIDIALYHLHSRISPRNIPELRVKRYDNAIDWLKKAGKGDITANLPVKQVHQGSRIRFGGHVKLNNRY